MVGIQLYKTSTNNFFKCYLEVNHFPRKWCIWIFSQVKHRNAVLFNFFLQIPQLSLHFIASSDFIDKLLVNNKAVNPDEDRWYSKRSNPINLSYLSLKCIHIGVELKNVIAKVHNLSFLHQTYQSAWVINIWTRYYISKLSKAQFTKFANTVVCCFRLQEQLAQGHLFTLEQGHFAFVKPPGLLFDYLWIFSFNCKKNRTIKLYLDKNKFTFIMRSLVFILDISSYLQCQFLVPSTAKRIDGNYENIRFP